jgi:hypothetical protein
MAVVIARMMVFLLLTCHWLLRYHVGIDMDVDISYRRYGSAPPATGQRCAVFRGYSFPPSVFRSDVFHIYTVAPVGGGGGRVALCSPVRGVRQAPPEVRRTYRRTWTVRTRHRSAGPYDDCRYGTKGSSWNQVFLMEPGVPHGTSDMNHIYSEIIYGKHCPWVFLFFVSISMTNSAEPITPECP